MKLRIFEDKLIRIVTSMTFGRDFFTDSETVDGNDVPEDSG